MGLPVSTRADPPRGGWAWVRSPWALARAALAAPFTGRQVRELLFCLAGLPLVVVSPVALFVLAADLISVASGRGGNPSAADMALACVCLAPLLVVLVLLVSTGAARRLGSVQRTLATRLLGTEVEAPPPARRSAGAGVWAGPGLRDGAGWRVIAYLLVKLPVGLAELYAVFFWIGGLVNLRYPLLWGAFRNNPPGVRQSPVPVYTPFGLFGHGTFRVATLPGTFAAAAVGAAMLMAAPWVTRAVTSADAWLIRGLLGPGRMAQRVHDLELSRALAVDDSAALRGAKDALGELRSLARGIHPPVLDNGLAEALSSLADDSAIPVESEVSIPVRPTPAIETIAYFCAAELLANAAKHSYANRITIRAAGSGDVLLLSVADDGTGGADPARGTGLSGLAQRVAVVDGQLTVASPPGGPTRITVELPMRA